MAYQSFDATKPAGTQTGPQFAASANANDAALRDAALAGGMFAGFDFTVSGGTAAQPATFFLKQSTTWLRATPTWGSGAGKDGNITEMAWDLSTNSGGAYDAIGTSTLNFDTSGNLTSATGAAGWLAWLMGLMGKVYKAIADLTAHVSGAGHFVHSLGTMSEQNVNAVAITGGSVSCTIEREAKIVKGNVAGSTSVDWAASGLCTLTVTNAAGTLTWSNLPSGVVGYMTLEVTNGAIATSLLTAQKPGGTALVWTNPGKDIVTLMCHDGATVNVVGFAKDVR